MTVQIRLWGGLERVSSFALVGEDRRIRIRVGFGGVREIEEGDRCVDEVIIPCQPLRTGWRSDLTGRIERDPCWVSDSRTG